MTYCESHAHNKWDKFYPKWRERNYAPLVPHKRSEMDYAEIDAEYELLSRQYGGLLGTSGDWQSEVGVAIPTVVIKGVICHLPDRIDAALPGNHASLLKRLIPRVRCGIVNNRVFGATAACGEHGLYAYVYSNVWNVLEGLFSALCEAETFREHPTIRQLKLSATETAKPRNPSADRAGQITRLAVLVWEYLLLHEIGHLLGGHLAYFVRAGLTAELAEADLETEIPEGMPFQEAELDADRYAVEMLCRRLRGLAAEQRTVRDDYDIMILLYLCVCIVSYLLVNLRTRSETSKHPSPPARFLYATAVIFNELGKQQLKGRSLNHDKLVGDVTDLLSHVPGMLEFPTCPFPDMNDRDVWWGHLFRIREDPLQPLIPGKYELLRLLEGRICGSHG